MDFVIDFINVGDGDAIILWARDFEKSDYVFFLDGGRAGNGQKIIDHYNSWIKPNLYDSRAIGFINSHPHEDHIDGLLEILEKIEDQISFAIYNDPVECITEEHRERIRRAYMDGEDPDITHLYETFEQIEKLNDFCSRRHVARFKAFVEDVNFWNGVFKILSPSKDFYVNLVQYFTDVDFLKAVDFSMEQIKEINEEEEEAKPCTIVDETKDDSPENLSSTIIQLTDGKGRKYILTADAGVDSFDYMEEETFEPGNIEIVQLPHHGSRRNVSTKWILKFKPKMFIVSAEGNVKHPRRAVVNCIKRNLDGCKVYSTHNNNNWLSYTTNSDIFPKRPNSPANSL